MLEVETGEDPPATACREVREETGLIAEVDDVVWVASNFHDPAKLTADFLLHPAMELDEAARQRFVAGTACRLYKCLVVCLFVTQKFINRTAKQARKIQYGLRIWRRFKITHNFWFNSFFFNELKCFSRF